MTEPNETSMGAADRTSARGVEDRHLPHPHRTGIQPRGGRALIAEAGKDSGAVAMADEDGPAGDISMPGVAGGSGGEGHVVFESAATSAAADPSDPDEEGFGLVMIDNATAGNREGSASAAPVGVDDVAEGAVGDEAVGHGFVFLDDKTGDPEEDEAPDAESFGYVIDDGAAPSDED